MRIVKGDFRAVRVIHTTLLTDLKTYMPSKRRFPGLPLHTKLLEGLKPGEQTLGTASVNTS
jgi:hypothetical protein